MRISDWSSDVCSSDLPLHRRRVGKAVDPADEFDVVGAPWRVGAHAAHIFLDRLYRRGIAPAERHMDDAGGNGEILKVAEALLRGDQRRQRGALVQLIAVEMQLQRSDARNDIDDAGQSQPFQLRHQRVDPYPKLYVERSEEHTSELQSLMRISYAVFCLKKKNIQLSV